MSYCWSFFLKAYFLVNIVKMFLFYINIFTFSQTNTKYNLSNTLGIYRSEMEDWAIEVFQCIKCLNFWLLRVIILVSSFWWLFKIWKLPRFILKKNHMMMKTNLMHSICTVPIRQSHIPHSGSPAVEMEYHSSC